MCLYTCCIGYTVHDTLVHIRALLLLLVFYVITVDVVIVTSEATNKTGGLKMICNDFLVVRVNCWSYVFNIMNNM